MDMKKKEVIHFLPRRIRIFDFYTDIQQGRTYVEIYI